MTDTIAEPQARPFEADVARLLQLMVHAVYSDREVFLRELVANAADACEKLRFEALSDARLLGEDADPRITITLDPAARTMEVADNGIGMSEGELADALGTLARSGTRAFMERAAAKAGPGEGGPDQLIGQFGVGFYSAFMVADRVDVVSRRAGSDAAARWSSDGLGTFIVAAVDLADAPARGTRVLLHLKEDAAEWTGAPAIERAVRAQSGHVPVPILLRDTPDAEPRAITEGAALWTRPRSDVTPDDYKEFYRSLGAWDDPALTIHYRAEGLHEYTVLAFVPGAKPFDLFDPERAGGMKLYVRRVFITDSAELLPRWLRFVRGLVDSADLPLNMSREMIQRSAGLAAIQKALTGRILSELEKLSTAEPETYLSVWDNFGAVLKEGLYEDAGRREQLLGLARFRSTHGDGWRSLADYVADLKPNQTAIYYATGNDLERLASSPQLEGFRARGVEVLLLPDQVDSFWVTAGLDRDGKPFRSVTQGSADLALIPLADGAAPPPETPATVTGFIAFLKETLGSAVSDVRASERLTDSAACLVAPEHGMDRELERMLAGAGRVVPGAAPVLEINPRHALVARLAEADAGDGEFRADAAHLLLDEARIADGEPPADPRAFSARLARVLARAAG